jgi:hypothetical protein
MVSVKLGEIFPFMSISRMKSPIGYVSVNVTSMVPVLPGGIVVLAIDATTHSHEGVIAFAKKVVTPLFVM